MNRPVLEIVEFRASGDSEALLAAARGMEPWLRAQPGFRSRRLAALDDGGYLDCVEWMDMASAKSAADQIMTAPLTAAFLALIDMQTVNMRHTNLLLSQ
jgi:hypothetical protein